MREMDAFEQAYKNGYAAGQRDAVKHGVWEIIETECYAEWCRCSVCSERDRHPRGVSIPYCWHCGAKMAEEKVDMEEDDG